MGKEEIIERLEEIAKHAVHVLGEEPFFMSLDDGIAIHEAIDILKDAQPDADVRPNVRGEWKHETKHYKDDEQEFYYIETTCSNCGINASKPWQQTNYCWNCGADMRGDNNED